MKLLDSKADIEFLIPAFYQKVLADETIGYIFTDVARIDAATHFPKIIDFWCSVLLDTAGYPGNVMQVHLDLHAKTPLKPGHFDRWLELWESTIREHFEGENAERAIQRAISIAMIMQSKINR